MEVPSLREGGGAASGIVPAGSARLLLALREGQCQLDADAKRVAALFHDAALAIAALGDELEQAQA